MHNDIPVGAHELCHTKRFQLLQVAPECAMKSISQCVSNSDTDGTQK